MSNPRQTCRPDFWKRYPLKRLTPVEWEALCDGCGKCCLNKLEDPDTEEVALTRVACRLLDDETCRCGQYDIRRQLVPECIFLTPKNLDQHAYWMPNTCAYKLLWQGRDLPEWHPLLTGDPDSVHRAGISVKDMTVSEAKIPEDEWEDYIIEEIR
jgi:uncharacterized cysteine cluster protein YcgN (CxxCxxCC family)